VQVEWRVMMRRVGKVLLVIMILWICIISIDMLAVFALHNRPLFMVLTSSTAHDDGSGIYNGLGYTFEIEGHFNDCDCILQGVVKAKAYVLKLPVYKMERTFEP